MPNRSRFARRHKALQPGVHKLNGDLYEAHERIAELKAALKPFALAVYNDNNDVTIVTSHIHTGDYMRAKRVLEKNRRDER